MNEPNEQLRRALAETATERESYKFMRKHVHDFSPCEANASILTQYIQTHNLEWNQDNLEKAYAECKNQLVASDVPTLAPITAPAADALPPAPAGVTWPSSKAEINAMSQTDYRREFHNTKTGAAFRARINFILQRGL